MSMSPFHTHSPHYVCVPSFTLMSPPMSMFPLLSISPPMYMFPSYTHVYVPSLHSYSHPLDTHVPSMYTHLPPHIYVPSLHSCLTARPINTSVLPNVYIQSLLKFLLSFPMVASTTPVIVSQTATDI